MMTRPKNTIRMAPICLIKSWFLSKNEPRNDVPYPRAIKIRENPIKKNSVWSMLLFFNIAFSDFISPTLIPVI